MGINSKENYLIKPILFVVVYIAIEFMQIEDLNLSLIIFLAQKILLLMAVMYFFLGIKSRILLISFFVGLICLNIQIFLYGLFLFVSLESYQMNSLHNIMTFTSISTGVFLLIGIFKLNIKYLSDKINFTIKELLLISIIITIIGQITFIAIF